MIIYIYIYVYIQKHDEDRWIAWILPHKTVGIPALTLHPSFGKATDFPTEPGLIL